MSAAQTLQKQFRGTSSNAELLKNTVPGFQISLRDDNIFEWEYSR